MFYFVVRFVCFMIRLMWFIDRQLENMSFSFFVEYLCMQFIGGHEVRSDMFALPVGFQIQK